LVKTRRLFNIAFTVILIAQIGVMAYWGAQKEGTHKDEINTFYQTNGDDLRRFYYEKGFFEKWMPSGNWINGITVNDTNRFDFQATYLKSRQNTAHPPLFFLTYHFTMSLFPNWFSFWPGIGLNILYFIGCSLFLYNISRSLIKDDLLSLLPCLFWGLSAAAVNGVTFLRMYMMLTYMCLGFSFFITRLIINGFSARRLASAAIFTFLGVMTQYYFLIYAFLLSSMYIFYMLRKREIKGALRFSAAMTLALIASYLCNPSIIQNTLRDHRGVEAMENAVIGTGFAVNLQKYINIISESIFTAQMNIILGAVVMLSIILILARGAVMKKRLNVNYATALRDMFRSSVKNSGRKFIFFFYFLTGIVYIIIVARIAPMQYDRYIMCVMPALVLSFIAALDFIRTRLNINRMGFAIAAVLLTLLLSFTSMPGQLNYLYASDSKFTKALGKNEGVPIVLILDKEYRYNISNFHLEIMNHNSYVYVTTDDKMDALNAEVLAEHITDGAIVYVPKSIDQGAAIASIANAAGLINNEKMFSHDGHTAYRLYIK
jgi:hypothetical protein